jgi:hypothetical protein
MNEQHTGEGSYADPAGLHEGRYFDRRWTDQVVTGGDATPAGSPAGGAGEQLRPGPDHTGQWAGARHRLPGALRGDTVGALIEGARVSQGRRAMRRPTLLVLLPAALVLAACGGGTKGHGAVAHSGGNIAAFCADYIAATQAYQDTQGDVTDPAFPQFLSLLSKAQAEAPAAVAAPVSAMLRVARDAQKTNSSGDLTAYSTTVSAWGDTHCPQVGASSSPAATDTPTDSPTPAVQDSGQGGPPSGASDAPAGFCADSGTVTQEISDLNDRSVGGDTDPPSTADWQAAATAVRSLAAEAPATDSSGRSKTRDDITTLAGEVEDVVAHGYDGRAARYLNLAGDVSLVEIDAGMLSC